MNTKIYIQKFSELLDKKGVKISVLAKAIGKNPNTITNYLKGSTKIDVDTLMQIADYFGVPVSYFFGESVPEVKAGSDLRTQLEICLEKLKAKEEVIKAKDEIIALLKDQLNRKS